jgi:hypothetical protein
MTSQETARKEELVEEAKSLGIKGAHLCGIPKLVEKIAEAKAVKEKDSVPPDIDPEAGNVKVIEESIEKVIEDMPEKAPRKVAPRMSVASISQDERSKKVAELEAANPGYKYIFKASSTTKAQLEAIGLESTGEFLKNDLICRTEKDSFIEWQKTKNDAQRRLMDSIDTEGTKIKSHDAHAKRPNKGKAK